MDRKKDQFCKHVEKLDCCLNVFKIDFCLKYKFCEHKFDGGVSRIKSHLAEVIDHDIVICKKATKIVQEEAYLSLKKRKRKKKKKKKKLI